MNIKSIIYSAILLSIANSELSHSGVFKCKDASGKIEYQSSPCEATETSREIIKSPKKKANNGTQNSGVKNGPSGRWVSAKNSTLRATITSSGSFEMTGIDGGRLTGNWQAKNNNAFTVNASFQGISFPVNMRYDSSNDTLRLSKPGLPSSYNTYQRQ